MPNDHTPSESNEPTITPPEPSRLYDREGRVPQHPQIHEVDGLTTRPRLEEPLQLDAPTYHELMQLRVEYQNLHPHKAEVIQGDAEPTSSEQAREQKLTQEYLHPQSNIVLERLFAGLEQLPPESRAEYRVRLGNGELSAFGIIQTEGGESWEKIRIADALKAKDEDSTICFVLQPDQPTTHEQVMESYPRAQDFDPRYVVLKSSKKEQPQHSVGYAKNSLVQQLVEANQTNKEFVFESASGLQPSVEFFTHRSERETQAGVLRDAQIALNQDLPNWLRNQLEVRKRFVDVASRFLVAVEEGRMPELFNLKNEVLDQAWLNAIDQIKQRVSDPFLLDYSLSPHVSLEFSGTLRELFVVSEGNGAFSLEDLFRKLGKEWECKLAVSGVEVGYNPDLQKLDLGELKSTVGVIEEIRLRHKDFRTGRLDIFFEKLRGGEQINLLEVVSRLIDPDYFTSVKVAGIDLISMFHMSQPPENI